MSCSKEYSLARHTAKVRYTKYFGGLYGVRLTNGINNRQAITAYYNISVNSSLAPLKSLFLFR